VIYVKQRCTSGQDLVAHRYQTAAHGADLQDAFPEAGDKVLRSPLTHIFSRAFCITLLLFWFPGLVGIMLIFLWQFNVPICLSLKIFRTRDLCLNKLNSNSSFTPDGVFWHFARTISQAFQCSVSLPQGRPLLLLYFVTRNTGPNAFLVATEVTATCAVEQELETATAVQRRCADKLLLGDVAFVKDALKIERICQRCYLSSF